jgi:hypothetical protein
MARVPSLFLKREDFKEVSDEWMDRLLRPLNTFGKQVQDALSRGLTLQENSRAFVKAITVTTGAGFAPLPYATGWSDRNDANYANASYMLDRGEIVCRGLTNSSASSGALLGTLPAGRRPGVGDIFVVATSAGTDRVLVKPDGTLTLLGTPPPVGGWVSLAGVRLRAADGAASPLPGLPIRIKNELPGNARPSGVIIVDARDVTNAAAFPVSLGSPAWSVSTDQVVISGVIGLQPNRKYLLTLAVLGG